MNDPVLLALSNKFYDSFDPNVAKKNAQNLSEDLIRLSLSAHGHAFTKDITDSNKIKSKRSKERLLSTSLKITSSSLEFGH